MTYKRALSLSIAFALAYALYSIVTGYLFPDLWTPTTTRFESWFDRVYFSTVGIFVSVWSAKHDPS